MISNNLQIYLSCYNESENIENTLSECLDVVKRIELFDSIEVIVVDNNSSDETLNSVNKFNVRVVSLKKNEMYSGSVFFALMDSVAEHIIILDGDGQFPPQYIENLATMIPHKYDLILGSRDFIIGGLVRKIGSKSFKFISKIILGFDGPDLNAGFRYVSRNFVNNLEGVHRGRLSNPSLWYLAKNKNLKTAFIQIAPRPRKFGSSSIPWNQPLHLIWSSIIELLKIKNKSFDILKREEK